MKHTIVGVLLALAMLCVPAAAQPGPQRRGSGGWGPQGTYGRMYDPKTVETLAGEVVRVEHATPMRGMGRGVHLVLRTDAGDTIPVHLGPAWYIENQDVTIAPKDRVEVKGSRVTVDGKPAIIAAEVRKGDDTLVLRDAAGIPAWSGWRRRGGPQP